MGIGIQVELTVQQIANGIKKMKNPDKEMLLLLLSGKNKELAKRVNEIKQGKVKTLTRAEVMQDVLQR